MTKEISKKENNSIIPQEAIASKNFFIRDEKVILDNDLATLYDVETKQLKRQVRRNIDRFPDDFMFQLTQEEYQDFLRCQIGTLKRGRHSKYPPYVFTEQGVAMLSSILNSKRAIMINIQIIRVFTKLRKILTAHADIKRKIEEHDEHIKSIFDVLKQLLQPPEEPKELIGFKGD